MKVEKSRRKSSLSIIVTVIVLVIISVTSEDINPLEALIALFTEEGAVYSESYEYENNSTVLETGNSSSEQVLTAIKYEKVTVERVVDGDTIVIDEEGKHIRVRLIGVNTPESVKEKTYEYYGKEASNYTKEQLSNREIYLEKDIEPQDRYGRELRYIWLKEPYEENFVEDCYCAILVREGYARAVVFGQNDKYYDILVELEAEAKASKKGLWGKE